MMKRGFTLLETLMVVAVMSIIMTGIVGIMLNSFRVKSRVSLTDVLEQNGSAVLSEIRKNVINAKASSIVCAEGSVNFQNVKDIEGKTTIIGCFNNKIASQSAGRADVVLTGTEVTVVSDCLDFVTCGTDLVTGNVKKVDFNFVLRVGTSINNQEREFNSSVVVRNRE